jgi:hypothetical protein
MSQAPGFSGMPDSASVPAPSPAHPARALGETDVAHDARESGDELRGFDPVDASIVRWISVAVMATD